LEGGEGDDTAVYYGKQLDYDIRKNLDGSWTVNNVRGAKDAGSDTLKNIEFVQFDGDKIDDPKKTYELKKKGLTFQADFALVIDTTASMGSSIDSVKAQASSLIDAVFADGKNDGRMGVVGFKDTTEGEPPQVLLPFTDQDDFAERKSAAIAAIDAITVDGGGDPPETAYDGLRLALNGSMGQWRFGAGTLRVALFTDAAAKDGELADEVNALANRIGAIVTKTSSFASVGQSIPLASQQQVVEQVVQDYLDLGTQMLMKTFPLYCLTSRSILTQRLRKYKYLQYLLDRQLLILQHLLKSPVITVVLSCQHRPTMSW
jgi:von Willebrand factor type A domain